MDFSSKGEGWRERGDVPDDAVKGCDAEEIPARVDPAPQLVECQ